LQLGFDQERMTHYGTPGRNPHLCGALVHAERDQARTRKNHHRGDHESWQPV
jgi:hypothetical protein